VEFFAVSTDVKKVRMAVRAGGYTLQLRSGRAQQYIPASLVSSNKGWQNWWFYLRNDDGMLPLFSQRVVIAAGNNWHWGPHARTRRSSSPFRVPCRSYELRALPLRGSSPLSIAGGAPFGRAAVAALRDEAGGRFGGLADVLDLPLH
jgi:hypothetical protein